MLTRRLSVVAVCLAWLVAAGSLAHAADHPPNVVIILSDDHAWNDYGFMGSQDVRTPHIDKLAAGGATFTNGYVPMSLCRTSLMSLATGLYPQQHKITGNDPPKGTPRQEMLQHVRAAPCLPRLLAEKGYVSFQAGKGWEGNYREGGFTAGMTHGDPEQGGRHGDEGLKIGRQGLQPVFDFIDDAEGKPFFLWYAPIMPHTPHNPPERLLAKYRKPGVTEPVAKYRAMVEWFDETCGELLKHLEEKGALDDTIVIYLADNGWIQLPNANGYAPKSKRSPYDGGLRTPIIVSWPGHIEPKRYDQPLSSINVAPTILAAAKIEKPAVMTGVNLLDVIAGTTAFPDTVYGAIFDHDVADIDDPLKSLHFRWCREGAWKVIVPRAPGATVELYNVIDDPWETRNVAGEQPDVAQRLSAKVDRWYPEAAAKP